MKHEIPIESIRKNGWRHIGIEYPPLDEVVLVTDGLSYQLRILRLDDNQNKYWQTLMEDIEPFAVVWWQPLPDLP